MDETGKDGQYLGLDEQGAPQMKRSRFPIAVRLANMPEDLGKLLDRGLEEHFRGC